MAIYTIDRVKVEEFCGYKCTDIDVEKYFNEEAPRIAELFDNVFDWRNCNVAELAEKMILLVCRRNGELRGFMLCALYTNTFDPKVKILKQLAFNVKPDSGRTAYHLFRKFLDIGKAEANHIITMLTRHTNIKPSTLEAFGFEQLEVQYRLEIK